MYQFRTLQLAKMFYKECKTLKLQDPMKDQFQRASLSIPLNLAEGSAKPTARDRAKFYRIALGSLREVQVILDLNESNELKLKADTLAAHIYKLCKNTH